MWLAETANTRLHATTRERPCERLLLERPRLHPLPVHSYDTDVLLPLVVSKEARVRLDSNSYSVPPEFAGKSVHLRANDTSVRILHEGTEVAHHERCWDRHRHIEDAHHIQRLLERRKLALGPKRKERLASLSPEARLYLQEVARRPIRLNNECRALLRLTLQYSDAEVAAAMARALVLRTFGARYVRALIDQARFAQGLAEPPEPILTGNAIADSLDVQPHPLDSYDALPPQKPNLRLPS
ncbi:hypothetical protein WA016_01960 [Myxococcus stipitatus]